MVKERWLTSCFGLGFLPIAPGTWGSLPVAVIFGLLSSVGASTVLVSVVMIALAIVGSFVCVRFAPSIITLTGKNDPGEVVADEVAGQAITFLALGSLSVSQSWLAALIGFLLFRLLDILKPWPACRLEKLPKGWGILADDLAAGIYAAIALQFCTRL